MADEAPTQPAPESAPDAAPLAPSRGLRDAWQIPAALIGLALLSLGVVTAIRRAPGPDFEGVLKDAEAHLSHHQPANALDLLNGPIVDEIGKPGAAGPELLARFYALRGDSLFLAHREQRKPMNTQKGRLNNNRTLEEYEKAEHLDHHIMTPQRLAFQVETLLDLERTDEAIEHLEHLPPEEAPRRRRLYKRIINEGLVGTPAQAERAMHVLERFREDEGLEESDRVWALVTHYRAAVRRGEADRVIDELLPEIPRLEDPRSSEAADLHLLLGSAYLESGEIEQARSHFAHAESILPPGDARRGAIDHSLARIAQSKGEIEEARDRYASVAERFPGTDAHFEALLGLGETEADLGHIEESLTAYHALVERLRESGRAGMVTPDIAEISMEQRHRVRMAAGDLDRAREYADLIVQAYPENHAPASASLRLAETHRDIASKLLGGLVDEYESAGRISLLDPALVEQARVHLNQSGKAYAMHARAAMVSSPEEASASLWNAADLLDRAGEQREAIRLFNEYASSRRQDPKQLESKYRLGRCFQSLNEYTTAITLFEEVVRANPSADEAYRSYVPLAQCYLLASNDTETDKAEALLMQVLDGRLFQPDSPQFKRALLELGQLYLRIGRFPDAITRLNEAIERYPGSIEETRLRFELADANRLSAAQVEKQLKDAMPVSERAELEQIRIDRLEKALVLYEEVRLRLDGSDPTRLTPLQRMLLRNASLYRGDCAFDLGNYELAIRHYDAAAQRLANDPASLVPMVQIVNCYAALGRLPEARTAHERAKARLKEIPESTWQGAAVPMDRRHWERWLESSLRLDQLEAKASTADASP